MGTKPLAPITTSTYLSGVRKYLQNNGVDTQIFDSSQYIRQTRQGIANYYRSVINETAADRKRIPITLDLIQQNHRSEPSSLIETVLYTAQILAYTIVARISEYIKCPKSDHHLRTRDIQFWTARGEQKPAHTPPTDWATVTAVTINVRSKKNDPEKRGHKYYFATAKSTDQYCIVKVLWTYATEIHPEADKPLFYIPHIQWLLTPAFFRTHLKKLANRFHLDPARVCPHSIRIGGATTLAAAGLEGPTIKKHGGWRSAAFLEYILQNAMLYEQARSALASPQALTISDIQKVSETTKKRAHAGDTPGKNPKKHKPFTA
jgi:hypothetical protein